MEPPLVGAAIASVGIPENVLPRGTIDSELVRKLSAYKY